MVNWLSTYTKHKPQLGTWALVQLGFPNPIVLKKFPINRDLLCWFKINSVKSQQNRYPIENKAQYTHSRNDDQNIWIISWNSLKIT